MKTVHYAFCFTLVYAALLTGWIAHDYMQYQTVTSSITGMPPALHGKNGN